MIAAVVAALTARAAEPPPPCAVLPAPVVHRWPLRQDGRDLRGQAPLAAVGPVGWPLPWTREDQAFVALTPGSRLEAPGVALPAAWVLEGWFDLRAADAGGELLRVEGGDRWLTVGFDRAAGEVVLEDHAGQVRRAPARAGPGRIGVAVDDGGARLVGGDGPAAPDGPGVEAPTGPVRIAVGAGGGRFAVRDLVLHGRAAAVGTAPWCLPRATRPVPLVEPAPRQPTLAFAGYFLGWVGWVPGNTFVARQRLLLEPTVRLSRHTRVTVGIRALDARSVDRTGSTLQPVPPPASALGEYGVVVEHAYLARWVGEWRLFPFYFVAGRVPLTFGMGLDDRHPMASLAPPPPSSTALLDAGERTGLQPENGDQFGDPTFPSTLDGPMLFLGAPPGTTSRLLVGMRAGRHNPWCTGRSAPVCPDVYAATYEVVATVLAEQQLRSGPLVDTDGLVVQAEPGLRWAPGLRPSALLRMAAAYVRPREEAVWVAAAFEAVGSTGIRGGPAPGAAAAPDPSLPAPQFLGDVVGGAARVDLALRSAAWGTLTAEGGATGALRGIAEGDAPVRGFHPDYNFDQVLFSQVVAEATATADPAVVVPSLGGVVNAAFARVGPTIRVGSRSGIEVPLFAAAAWSVAPLPGVMDRGWLGLELDTALRLHSGQWRLAADFGWLVAPGPALSPVSLDPARPTSLELRIGRDL